MQDAYDLDRSCFRHPIHQEMASATAVARNVERAKTTDHFIPGLGAHNIRTGGKFTKSLGGAYSDRYETVARRTAPWSFDDICEIKLCGSAEANEHFCAAIRFSFGHSGNDFL